MQNGEEVVGRVPLRMGSVSMTSINRLPDELLIKILSFLPTKKAASTSVLAKRWRTLFSVRHDLDFDDSVFYNPEVDEQNMEDIQESFRTFIDSTLTLQGGVTINKFSLKCGDTHSEDQVDYWIDKALEHNVSEFHLHITDVMRCHLPSNLFISKTIVKLTLGTQISVVRLPSETSLPVLKIFFLDSVWFDSKEFYTLLLAGCPVLEDLTIHHKSFTGMPDTISSKTVKRLSITYKCADDVEDVFGFVTLDVPNLVYLFYSDYALCSYPHCNLDSLVKATLDLHFLEEDEWHHPFDPNVTDLIYGIRNVKILELTYSAAEVISEGCKGGLPMFVNLLELVFSGNKERVWKELLPLMLEHSPNLKTLVLEGLYQCPYEHQFDGIRIPPSNQVKMLSIMQYKGSENELKHISHFLLKMECLEVVKVSFAPTMDDAAKKVQLRENLLKLPTASSKLKMQLM